MKVFSVVKIYACSLPKYGFLSIRFRGLLIFISQPFLPKFIIRFFFFTLLVFIGLAHYHMRSFLGETACLKAVLLR